MGASFTKSCPPVASRISSSNILIKIFFFASYRYNPSFFATYISISCQFTAEGAVLFPSSGRFTPKAAHSKLDNSCRDRSLLLKDRIVLLSFKTSINGLPPFICGAGSLISFPCSAKPTRGETKISNRQTIQACSNLYILSSFL